MEPDSTPLRRTSPLRPLRRLLILFVSAVLAGTAAANLRAHELQAEATVAYRHFPSAPADPRQHDDVGLVTVLAEYWHDWDDGTQRLVFSPFARVYDVADERTHGDIQELYWRKSFNSFDLSAGVRKYFWGKTESVHLVDILNQTDLVQDIDGELKLGQPVVDLTFITNMGDFSAYVSPYFRERRFPDAQGRVRFPLLVDTANPVYESSAEQEHVDLALRWSHYFGVWDVGLSYFDGTSREPRLEPALNAVGDPVLVPHYDQIRQFGLDVQATVDSWLWKFEGITRDSRLDNYFAAAAGFEYTLYGVASSAVDIGLLLEYLYDERGARTTTGFQDDVFLGTRLGFNDVQSSELLIGLIHDRDDNSRFGMAEGSRRIGSSWKIALEARFFSNIPAGSPLRGFASDDYLEISLTKFF